MNKNNADTIVIIERRASVASLFVRGTSVRNIQTALPPNAKTGKQWSLGTIDKDIHAIQRQWRESINVEMSLIKGQLVAELREMRRLQWLKGKNMDFNVVAKCIKQECDVLGISAATEIRIRFEDEAERMARELGLDPQELIREAEEIMKRANNKV